MKNILNLIARLKKSPYVRNVATLATGTTMAQAVSLITAPILYRIYSQVDYGTLGLYMAIVGVVGVFSTMQYVQPILLEKEDDDAKYVMWLNRVINVSVSILIMLFVAVFGTYIGRLLGNEGIAPWLWLAPISVFFGGQGQIFEIWANRKKKYKILSFNAILSAILVPIVSISVGLYDNGPLGLFLGLLVSQVVPPIVLLITLTKYDDLGLKYLKWDRIKMKAKQHKSFPIYRLPSDFINRLSNQLPVFMLSAFAGPAVVGIYNLCVRMLGLPIQLIGGALSTVFQQKAAQDFNETGSFNAIYVKTFKMLSLIAIVPLFIMLLFGPFIFAFVFGEEWRESGIFARIIIGMYMMKLIVSPLSYSWYILNRLQESFLIHIYMLVSNFLIFMVGFKLTDNYLIVIGLFSVNYILIYLYTLTRTYTLSKKRILL